MVLLHFWKSGKKGFAPLFQKWKEGFYSIFHYFVKKSNRRGAENLGSLLKKLIQINTYLNQLNTIQQTV